MTHIKLFRGEDKKPIVKSAAYRLLFTVPGTSPAKNFHVMEADSVTDTQWRPRALDFARRARKIFDAHNIGVEEVQPTH